MDRSEEINKNLEAIFEQIHKEIKDKGGYEAVGLFSDEDVADMISEQRNDQIDFNTHS